MTIRATVIAFVFVVSSVLALSQSAERSAILDASRSYFEPIIGGRLIFKVSTLKQKNNWAFLIAQPLRPGNRRIDWAATRFAEDVEAGAFDEEVIVLLKKSEKRWRAVIGVVGATDVPFGCWWKTYGAPKAIFTYVEDDCSYLVE